MGNTRWGGARNTKQQRQTTRSSKDKQHETAKTNNTKQQRQTTRSSKDKQHEAAKTNNTKQQRQTTRNSKDKQHETAQISNTNVIVAASRVAAADLRVVGAAGDGEGSSLRSRPCWERTAFSWSVQEDTMAGGWERHCPRRAASRLPMAPPPTMQTLKSATSSCCAALLTPRVQGREQDEETAPAAPAEE